MLTAHRRRSAIRASRRRDEGNPCPGGIHIDAQIQIQPNPGLIQQSPAKLKPKKILGFPSPNRALSRGYADPHGLFFFCAPIPPQRRPRGSVAAACSPLSVVLFRLHFGVLRSLEASEGLAPFLRSRTRWAPFPPDLPAAEPRCAKKGNPVRGSIPGSKARGPRTGNKDRPIDPMSGKNTSASQKARTGFRALASGRAPALHASRSISQSLPSRLIPFVSLMRGGCGRFCRARSGAFHPATDDPSAIPAEL